jgi:hypothetical protein
LSKRLNTGAGVVVTVGTCVGVCLGGDVDIRVGVEARGRASGIEDGGAAVGIGGRGVAHALNTRAIIKAALLMDINITSLGRPLQFSDNPFEVSMK